MKTPPSAAFSRADSACDILENAQEEVQGISDSARYGDEMTLAKRDSPTIRELMDATIQVMQKAGGPVEIHDIETALSEVLKLTPEQRAKKHRSSGRTEIGYRAAWARTKLKKENRIERVGARTWAIRKEG